MTKYVRGYRERGEREPKWPFELAENVDVEFSKEPEWQIPVRELAESERSILQNLGVHVGPHYRDFSVERLPEGSFAIVCSSHP